MKLLFIAHKVRAARDLKFYDNGTYCGVDGKDDKFSKWKVVDGVVMFLHASEDSGQYQECSTEVQEAYKKYVTSSFEQEFLNSDENQKSETIKDCGKQER